MPSQSVWPGHLDRLRKIWVQTLFPPIVMIALGTIAIAISFPGLLGYSDSGRYHSSLAQVSAIGSIILIGGNTRLLDLYFSRRWNGFNLESAMGLVYILAGVALLVYSHRAMAVADLMLISYFAVDGALGISRSQELRSNTEICWWVCGTLSIVRSVTLVAAFPYISIFFWALGLLSGIGLIFDGCCGISGRLAK